MSGGRVCPWEEASELLGERAERIVASVYNKARRKQLRSHAAVAAVCVVPWMLAWAGAVWAEQTYAKVFFVAIGVIAGGALGRRLVELAPLRVDLTQVFDFGPGSLRFWTGIESRYRKAKFLKLLKEQGPRPFLPRDTAQLRAALLEDEANWGAYPARVLRNIEIREAGIGEWVAGRTEGAVEMADALCDMPAVKSLNDLVNLIERIGKRAERIPAEA